MSQVSVCMYESSVCVYISQVSVCVYESSVCVCI
jgi:hypothetical protein